MNDKTPEEAARGRIVLESYHRPADYAKGVRRGKVSSLRDQHSAPIETTNENGQRVLKGQLITAKEQHRLRMARIRRVYRKLKALVDEVGLDRLPYKPGQVAKLEGIDFLITGYAYNEKIGRVVPTGRPVKAAKKEEGSDNAGE